MQTVKAEPYQPKSWMDEKQEELSQLDRSIKNIKDWIQTSKRNSYINISSEELGDAIIKLQIFERQRAFLRSAVKRVAALQQQIDFIQAHH